MKTTFFNSNGTDMNHSWFHVPMAYTKVMRGNKQLVIAEISSQARRLAYSLRNNENGRTGMIRYAAIHVDKKRGKYFLYKGTKVFLKDVGYVM